MLEAINAAGFDGAVRSGAVVVTFFGALASETFPEESFALTVNT